MNFRDMTIAALVAILVSGIFALPAFDRMRGLSIDILFLFRQMIFAPSVDRAKSNVAVIAIDEETYRRAPFRDTPKTMWTPQIARVLESVVAGGAKVVGFDIIFPTSVGKFLGGYDRPFLMALRKASRQGKVVLGKVQHQSKPITPHRAQSFAVGHLKNIRSTNAFKDPDGIIRRLPLVLEGIVKLTGKTKPEPTISLELVRRAIGLDKVDWIGGAVVVDGYTIPGSEKERITLNFLGGSGAIPTYSLVDLHRCAEMAKNNYFREHFENKVVLIGVVLDVEDRKLTSKRFITGLEGVGGADRCILPRMVGLYRKDLKRDSIPGVYIHATAINNMLNKNALKEVRLLIEWLISLTFALIAAFASLLITPIYMALFLIFVSITWCGITTYLFNYSFVLPLLDPITCGTITLGIMLAYRFFVADRDKRFLRRSFEFYLPTSVIDQLLKEDGALKPQTTEATILFVDIAGFTEMSEKLEPHEIVNILNEYFSAIVSVIERYKGVVTQFQGDAVLAIFNVPVADEQHASNAINTAKDICDLVSLSKFGGQQLSCRVGITTGNVVAGNVGAKDRLNYTVHGDVVNLAARLEQLNKEYGTSVLIAASTVDNVEDTRFIEIGNIQVRGKEENVSVYTLGS